MQAHQEVIDFLDSIMVPIKTIAPVHATFYRGDSKLDPGSPCRKENYISVIINIEDAISFIDHEEQGSISFIKLLTIDSSSCLHFCLIALSIALVSFISFYSLIR